MAVTNPQNDGPDAAKDGPQYYHPARTASSQASYAERLLKAIFRRRGGTRVVLRR